MTTDRATCAASRRERGDDDGRAASQPVKLGEAALQSALVSVFPVRLIGRTPALHARESRSEPGRGARKCGVKAVGKRPCPCNHHSRDRAPKQ
jgi:hypothetical protein